MTQHTSHILQQALQLPADEREILAVELMTHLHSSGESHIDVEAAWHAEIERRAAASELSSEGSSPFEEAWPRIAGKYA